MALGKETRKSDGGWFPSIIGPNDQGPRTRGTPHSGGMPTIAPCTPSCDVNKIPTWPELDGVQTGGVNTRT